MTPFAWSVRNRQVWDNKRQNNVCLCLGTACCEELSFFGGDEYVLKLGPGVTTRLQKKHQPRQPEQMNEAKSGDANCISVNI